MIFQLSFVSCAFRHGKAFQVLRGTPAYLLRSPDSRETPLTDVLRDYNGFEPAHSWIDLRPLMESSYRERLLREGLISQGTAGIFGNRDCALRNKV